MIQDENISVNKKDRERHLSLSNIISNLTILNVLIFYHINNLNYMYGISQLFFNYIIIHSNMIILKNRYN